MFEALQNKESYNIDFQEGILEFKIPSQEGKTPLTIELERKDLNEYYRIELEFRRLARRQFYVEKQLREEYRKTFKNLEEQKKKT